LRKWAVAAEQMDFQVNVSIGRRVIAILPHADVDLGDFGDGDSLVYDRHVVDGRLGAARAQGHVAANVRRH
jgi:hypothetical protein